MSDEAAIFVGASDADQYLLLKYGNRHGLIAGATGTGKTVTLQTIAEGFSAYGVPVFMADVKGDLSGISQPGGDNPKAVERAKQMGIEAYAGRAFPTAYWDLFGQKGHPIRTTVSEVGPVLMARLLQLNETQEGVLNIAFKVADEQGLLLLDFKDLQALLQWLAENAGQLTTEFGNVSKQSVGTIQRQLLMLDQQGGEGFFGEPALDLTDMIRCDAAGLGTINVLAADRLMQSPRLYGTFLLWLLSELFEALPEVGDLDKPKFVFFFDEAHLLFDDAPKALLEQDRAGGAADPLQGRRHLFHHPEPARYPRVGAGPARQPRPACVARLHAAGPEGGEGGGRDFPPEQEIRCRPGHHRAGRRRGAAVVPRPQGRADAGRALPDRPAPGAYRSREGCRAGGGHVCQPLGRQVRQGHRPGLRLRNADRPCRSVSSGRAGGSGRRRTEAARPVWLGAADGADHVGSLGHAAEVSPPVAAKKRRAQNPASRRHSRLRRPLSRGPGHRSAGRAIRSA